MLEKAISIMNGNETDGEKETNYNYILLSYIRYTLGPDVENESESVCVRRYFYHDDH